MTWRLLILLPVAWGALQMGVAGHVQAAPAPCPEVVVDADARTLERWPELPQQVQQAFARRDDLDRCARVRLTAVDGDIDVRVSLPDGRATSRRVRPQDVVPRLEALLLVPEAEAPSADQAPAASTEAAAPASPPPPPMGTTHLEALALEVHPEVSPPRHLNAELSLAAGFYRGDGQSRTSLGASALMDAAGWLVGFGARVDSYRPDAPEPGNSPGALEVGALVGARWRAGRLLFDAVAGPALALRGSWNVMTAAGEPGTRARTSSSDNVLVPRGVAGARLTLGARSVVRTFLTIEAEMGAAGPIPPGALRGLPLWSLGGALGVTVGTL